MYQQLGTTFPTYASEVQLWLSQGKLPPVFPELTMKGIILEWYQELLREHGESRWPEFAARAFTLVYVATKSCYRYFP